MMIFFFAIQIVLDLNSIENFYISSELFEDEQMKAEILRATEPRKMKACGRKVKNFDDDVWTQKCREFVKQANMAKVHEPCCFKA